MDAYNATSIDDFHVQFLLKNKHYRGGSPYHYIPTLWVCALYVALFSVSGLLHLIQAIYYRLWFLLPTAVVGNIGEIIGWAARLWSSKNPSLLDPYLIQTVTTIIAPTPLVAANFVILGELIKRLGPQYSRLSPMWYTIVFVTCDIIALVVQAVGGGKAALAVQNSKNPEDGSNIMLAGIVFQMVAITVYVMLAAEFIFRYLSDKPVRQVDIDSAQNPHWLDGKTKLMLLGLSFSSTTIFIRSVYRTVELADGWTGRIISTQVYFNVLDGAMIILATFALNFLHPGFLLGRGDQWGKSATTTPAQSLGSEEKPSYDRA